MKSFPDDPLEQTKWLRGSHVIQENFLRLEKCLQPLKFYRMVYLLLIKALIT